MSAATASALAMPALLQLSNPQSGVALPPPWGWYIILYFFLGGLAAGSYFIAGMLDLLGDPRDRDAVRLGYTIAFPLVVVCGILLVLDLGKPLRFWHLMIQSERPPLPMIKPWSPISIGTWFVSGFGLFSFVAFLRVLVDEGRLRWRPLVLARERARGLPRPLVLVWHALGIFFAFALGGYTGVLVTGTSLPVWHNARTMGALFLASAASSSYALLILLLLRRGRGHGDATVEKLARADHFSIILEMIVLALTLAILGGLARPLVRGGFGVVFWIGVVIVGMVLPLVFHSPGARWAGGAERRALLSAACALVGGFLLRFVVVMSPQWPRVPLWHL